MVRKEWKKALRNDWHKQEVILNQYDHFMTEPDGKQIHFVPVEGNGQTNTVGSHRAIPFPVLLNISYSELPEKAQYSPRLCRILLDFS